MMKSCSVTTSWVKKLCFVSSQSLYVQTSWSHLYISVWEGHRQVASTQPIKHVKETKLFLGARSSIDILFSLLYLQPVRI